MYDVVNLQSLTLRTKEKLSHPDTMPTICSHVANGGSVIDLIRWWDVRYSDVHIWIYSDPIRKKQYEEAMNQQTNWVIDRLLLELRSISFADARKLYADDGTLLPISEWADEVARAVGGIEVEEAKVDKFGNESQGRTKKVKLVDKLRAIELIGKNLKMFTERVDVNVKVTIEDLVMGSMQTVDAVAIPQRGGDDGKETEAEAVQAKA